MARRSIGRRSRFVGGSREPLGLDFTSEELQTEAGQTHLAAFREKELLGCLVIVWAPLDVAKMRQVAVSPAGQGQGVGRVLVRHSEVLAAARSSREMVLHARETAVGFYLRLGYEVEGEPFEEVGLSHRRMRKTISQP